MQAPSIITRQGVHHMLNQKESGRIILEVLIATAILGISTISIISGIAFGYNRVSEAFTSLKSQQDTAITPLNSNCLAIDLPSEISGIRCIRQKNNLEIFVK